MGEFQRALAAADLPPGQCAEAAVGGKAVAIFNVDGRFFALSNTCLHRGGPLGQGKKYNLRVPGLLGGEYGGENLGITTQVELIRASARVAKEVAPLPLRK